MKCKKAIYYHFLLFTSVNCQDLEVNQAKNFFSINLNIFIQVLN